MIDAKFKTYIGLPYKPLGRDRDGLDCWGLYRLIVGEQTGHWLTSGTDAYTDPDDADRLGPLIRGGKDDPDWVGGLPLAPLDCIAFTVAGDACHVGCYVGGGYMIHTLRGCSSVLERIGGFKWGKRLAFHRRPAALCGSHTRISPSVGLTTTS